VARIHLLFGGDSRTLEIARTIFGSAAAMLGMVEMARLHNEHTPQAAGQSPLMPDDVVASMMNQFISHWDDARTALEAFPADAITEIWGGWRAIAHRFGTKSGTK